MKRNPLIVATALAALAVAACAWLNRTEPANALAQDKDRKEK